MRCFFNLMGPGYVLDDEVGVVVYDVKEARREASAAVRELAGEEPDSARAWSGWRLEAVDAVGTPLFTVDLSQLDAGLCNQRRLASGKDTCIEPAQA